MKLRGFSLCVSIFIDCGNQSIHYYRLHSNDIDWFPIMIDFHRLGTPGQEAYDQYDHLVPPNDQTLWRSASCAHPSPSPTFVKMSASPAFHKLLLQKRSLERYTACNKIEFAITCTCHWRLRSFFSRLSKIVKTVRIRDLYRSRKFTCYFYRKKKFYATPSISVA